ncbi:hypothetical protein C8Q74DRAFT_223427 [Fomes fomentarius]|nr:hypothetical protein C8Q74DRAFT_223427 [Fomes fomentarius]
MSALPTYAGTLVGFVLETMLWGAYINLFFVSLVQLWRRCKTLTNLPPLIVANCSLCSLCTVHLALSFNHMYSMYGVPSQTDINNVFVASYVRDYIVILCNLLGQIMLLYRCWMLWGKNYLTIVPSCVFALAGFACHDITRRLSTSFAVDATPIDHLRIITIAGHALLLYANLSVTVCIASKLAQRPYPYLPPWANPVHSESAHEQDELGLSPPTTRSYSILEIVEKSGIGHFIAQLVLSVFIVADHSASSVVGAVVVQLYGIMPTLVALRAEFGSDLEVKTFLASGEEEPSVMADIPRPDFVSNGFIHG